MTDITVPTALYDEADRYAREDRSTADRKILKALRDAVKRGCRDYDRQYATCPTCGGLAVETEAAGLVFGCLECGDSWARR